MNIKPILVRLEGAMERNDLIEQMVLLPEPASAASKWAKSTKSVNLVVGYNASPQSQTALDLTMWIAHQTRLATQKEVTVQVVYVIGETPIPSCPNGFPSADINPSPIPSFPSGFPTTAASQTAATAVLTPAKSPALALAPEKKLTKKPYAEVANSQSDCFEQADHILWQARCLAQEWRGTFKAHLRFGDVATELRNVVESEAATLLFVGCNSVTHPLIQKLDSNFPCSVLGIPTDLCYST
ncbi:MAG TPA: hypothetical protein V6D11_19785 [Waterburya sp.]